MKIRKNQIVMLILCVGLVLATSLSWGAVTQEEADRLKSDLTPTGAERAGNADGTIPAWEGGISTPPPGMTTEKGVPLTDPFKDDKIKFTITAENMDQYADKLSEGTKWLLKKYPKTFHLNVYQTRRTAAVPQWVYDNTYQNALNASSTEDRLGMVNAHGGVAFPIPKCGEQAMFNLLTTYVGSSRISAYAAYIVNPSGPSLSSSGQTIENMPYYFQERPPAGQYADLWNMFLITTGPPRVKGEITLILDSSNPQAIPRRAWQYLPGQRRVRRAPTLAYDSPVGTNSLIVYDDMWMFSGALDRFNWKIIGKKEMYIVYNAYNIQTTSPEVYCMPGHPNPDMMRWELHRVWVVEAKLKEGERHVYGRRIFYLDEDTWLLSMKDQYDTRNEFWRFSIAAIWQDYTLPGAPSTPWHTFDVTVPYWYVEGCYYGQAHFLKNYEKEIQPQEIFTADYLRKSGRR